MCTESRITFSNCIKPMEWEWHFVHLGVNGEVFKCIDLCCYFFPQKSRDFCIQITLQHCYYFEQRSYIGYNTH